MPGMDDPGPAETIDFTEIEICRYHQPLLRKFGSLYQPATIRKFDERINCREMLSPATVSGYPQALRRLHRDRADVLKMFSDCDVLALPTMKFAARTNKRMMELEQETPLPTGNYLNTSIFDYLGLPAISVPCGFTSAGLPLGLQFAGSSYAEQKLFAMAESYEKATNWHLRKPTSDVTAGLPARP
jgi:aspartyl-tRNA(Asn)/glutamyl-tRNA(Gln) amidotransferase subunit A